MARSLTVVDRLDLIGAGGPERKLDHDRFGLYQSEA
jgi:hypothetical protein